MGLIKILMIEYLAPVLIAAFAYFLYCCVAKPYQTFRSYEKQIQARGYKLYKLPFIPFFVPFLPILKKSNQEGDSLGFVKKLYKGKDIVLTNSFHKIVLDLQHPDFIKDFYSNEHLYVYTKVQSLVAPIKRTMGAGIPFSQGEVWKRKRQIINKVFNFDLIKGMIGKIAILCDKAIEETESKAKKLEDGTLEFKILDLTILAFSSVIMECFLGGATNEQLENQQVCMFMTSLINDATINAGSVLGMFLGPKFIQAGIRPCDKSVNRRLKIFRAWGTDYVHKRVQEATERIKNLTQKRPPADIIEALVMDQMFRQKKGEDSELQAYSESQILQQFSTFFVAGTDTTSNYVQMMIYLIAQNPEVQQRLRQEIEENMKEDDYSYENLKKFKYIDWIQKQTSRFYGPVTGILIREAQEDNLLNGIKIKKGTYVTLQHLGNHYSEQYFTEPTKFRPERWESECDDLPAYVVGGFSGGARTCIGKHLAMVESKIFLIKFMKRYSKIILPKQDYKMVIKFMYAPEDFEIKLVPKNSQ